MESATARSVPTSAAAAERASPLMRVSRPNKFSRRARRVPSGSVAAGPAWADGGPRRLPHGEAMPVESRSAQPVADAEHYGGTCRDAEASEKCGEDHDTRTGRGSLRRSRPVQPDLYRGTDRRVIDGWGGHRGEDAGPFLSVGQPPPGDRGSGDSCHRPGMGQYRHGRPHTCRRRAFGLVEVPGEAHCCHDGNEEGRCQGHHYDSLDTVSGPPQFVPAQKQAARAPQWAARSAG